MLTTTTNRSTYCSRYSFQINRCCQKACGLVRLTKYPTAPDWCSTHFMKARTDLEVHSSLLGRHGQTSCSLHCNGQFRRSISSAFLTTVSQCLVQNWCSHACRTNGCNLLKVTQLPSGRIEWELRSLLTQAYSFWGKKKVISEKIVVSHEKQ